MSVRSAIPPIDQATLTGAIMNSPIVLRQPTLEARLADWQNTRHAPDIDEVILAWLGSHTGRRRVVLS